MGFAKDKGTEDVLYRQCKALSESFSKCPDFRAALENPVLPTDEKYSLVCAAAVGNGKVDATFADFIKLVLRNRREKLLQYMCLSFMDLYRQSKRETLAIYVPFIHGSVPSEQTYWRGPADYGCARESKGGRSYPK